MNIFDFPNYLWISIVVVVIFSILSSLIMKKHFISAILTFIVLGIIAFIIPNFYKITYEPLLGYAAFMAIVSLFVSLLTWYLMNKNKQRIANKQSKKMNNTQEEARKFEELKRREK
ncbi:hypothetical protein [Mammaliicoccus stepanovicii]|uniref:Permease n=1 Tax=Mammaliicoccus stepanovicii TaxID=643214 RepID=A0A239ZB73_9STAP|nr:hypothetical protein [Mammaliicoccus stepanovicii]PNZ74118.1 hypothetical protein CD111_09175 [Mammaliicoccus stepanovicii]GGI42112.1 hypothetical protein GCM10010896_16790 [Mammaliicoccus stepanovicii]SNV68395.1 Permease [Mammaliicoccus stepanovicii]